MISSRRARSASARVAISGRSCSSRIPKVAATRRGRRSASAVSASSTSQAPSGKSGTRSQASRRARRVLPMPPGPHRVRARTSLSKSASSLRSRSLPMKLFGSAGRLPGAGGAAEVMASRTVWLVAGGQRPTGRVLSVTDEYGNAGGVVKSTEIHQFDHCPPLRAAPGSNRYPDMITESYFFSGGDGKTSRPGMHRRPAAVRRDQLRLAADRRGGPVGQPDRQFPGPPGPDPDRRREHGDLHLGRDGLPGRRCQAPGSSGVQRLAGRRAAGRARPASRPWRPPGPGPARRGSGRRGSSARGPRPAGARTARSQCAWPSAGRS